MEHFRKKVLCQGFTLTTFFTDIGIPYFRTIQFFWRGYPVLAKIVLETDGLSQGHLPLEERK